MSVWLRKEGNQLPNKLWTHTVMTVSPDFSLSPHFHFFGETVTFTISDQMRGPHRGSRPPGGYLRLFLIPGAC